MCIGPRKKGSLARFIPRLGDQQANPRPDARADDDVAPIMFLALNARDTNKAGNKKGRDTKCRPLSVQNCRSGGKRAGGMA